MAIPRYGENKQTLERDSGARFQAADFGAGGEMIGRAVQQFGGAIGDAAKAHEIVTERYDEAAVRQADAEDAQEILKIKQAAMSAKGIDAQSAIEQANKDIAEVGKRRSATFSSSRQRSMYSDVFQRRSLGVQEQLGEHAVRQTEVAYQAGLDATIDSSTTIAVDSFEDPAEFDRNLAAVEEAVELKFKGMPPAVVTRAKSLARSNIHGKVVQSILSDPDRAADAAMYLRDNAADIEPETETQLYKMVNPFLDEERTSADATWAMSSAPPPDGSDHVSGEDYYPPADPATPTATKPPAPPTRFVSPLRGKEARISNSAAQHRARGSENAIDYAAPAGTPIYPPMSGKVVKNWWSEDGGWSVLVEHPNGHVTGYAHMRSKSALEPGEEVDRSTALGGVGNTGKSTGPHLHFTVRKSAGGPKVDPASIQWTDAGAVDPKRVAWKEEALPQYAAEDTNLVSSLSRLHQRATAEGWSVRRYEKAATEIRQRGAVNQSLYADANRRTEDAVWGTFAEAEEAGTPITSISQLGPAFAQLDGRAKSTVINMIQANKKALQGEGPEDGDDTFLDLLEASATDPEAFMAVDLRQIPMSKADRRRLVGVQSKLLGKDGQPSTYASSHTKVLTTIRRFAGMGNDVGFVVGAKKPEHKRREQVLFNSVNRKVEERQTFLKRELTDDEMQAIVKSETVAMTRNGVQMPRYVAERTPKKPGEVDQIEVPLDVKQNIIRTYQRAHGGAMPTNRQVVQRYLTWLSNNGG